MRLHKQVRIACTPATLWRHLTESELLKQWIPDLVDDTADEGVQPGLGATSTMRLREGSKVQSYRSVVTAWEPERKVAVRLTGGSFAAGSAMDVSYEFVPEANGCVLDYDVDIPLATLPFKLLAPLIWIVSTGNANKALTNLARLCSQGK